MKYIYFNLKTVICAKVTIYFCIMHIIIPNYLNIPMNLLKKLASHCNTTYKMHSFPLIPPNLSSLTTNFNLFIIPQIYKNATPFSNLSSTIINLLHEPKQIIPVIPAQSTTKPSFIFDLDNFIIHRTFPFSIFHKYKKRAYTGTFLFNMAHIYDLILLTAMDPHEGRSIINQIDPYGCIDYRMFVKDKKYFKKHNLNRDIAKTIFLQVDGNEEGISEDFSNNIIKIGKWDGKHDNKLLSLLDFCVNMHFFNVKDYRNTITSYKNKDFFKAFDFIQRKIFKERNIFSFNVNNAYKETVKKIYDERIAAYENAKIELDQHLLRDKALKRGKNPFNVIYNALISRIL